MLATRQITAASSSATRASILAPAARSRSTRVIVRSSSQRSSTNGSSEAAVATKRVILGGAALSAAALMLPQQRCVYLCVHSGSRCAVLGWCRDLHCTFRAATRHKQRKRGGLWLRPSTRPPTHHPPLPPPVPLPLRPPPSAKRCTWTWRRAIKTLGASSWGSTVGGYCFEELG